MSIKISRSSSYTTPYGSYEDDPEHNAASEHTFSQLLKSSKRNKRSPDFSQTTQKAKKLPDNTSLQPKVHIAYQGHVIHYRLLSGPLNGLCIKAWRDGTHIRIQWQPKPLHRAALEQAILKLKITLHQRMMPVIMEVKDAHA